MKELEPAPRPVVAALGSPLALMTGVAGGAVALVTGLPVAAALGSGALAYAAVAVVRLARRPSRPERIDPFGVGERWRPYVKGALQAQARYARTLETAAPGPLRERLEDIGRRIDRGVEECWRVAQRGHAIDGAVSTLGIRRARDRLAAGRAEDAGAEPVVQSLEAQLAAAGRLETVADAALERLRLLEARLDEAVATAVELTVSAPGPADAGCLGTDVDQVVDELQALRAALEETGGLG